MKNQDIAKIAATLQGRERESFLVKECGSDPAVRREVEALIASLTDEVSATQSFQSDSNTPDPTVAASPSELDEESLVSKDTNGEFEIGQEIGSYELVELLGEGGMGTVWLAAQNHPVKRQVALKVIKAGIGSKEVIARFDAERQALALMSHPNIAKILDAGTTTVGLPYFVMEYVEGEPLTSYCNRKRLGINERLSLFSDVCLGVQHAHQKGIIHRDLKPTNILVVEIDGVPVPKVIDFGLAKAIESREQLTDHSLYTGIGQILGTLKYMSPEQASLDFADIDTRTDIYSLGIILYELLTGVTPLDDDTFRDQAVLKMLELIRDKDPVKPSSQLNSDHQRLGEVVRQRGTDSSSLMRILIGDLDWIVMKALDKDRNRRYESASGLSADIGRYLKREPVVARPPSAAYRFHKFVSKNRLAVSAAALVTLTLILGVIGTSWGLVRALNAEELANQRFNDAEAARRDADEARNRESQRANSEREAKEQAEKRLSQIEKGSEILAGVFTNLDMRRVDRGKEPLEAVLAEQLKLAAEQLDGESIGDKLVVADLQDRLGDSLLNLGFQDSAVKLHQKSWQTRVAELGIDHPDTLDSRSRFANALFRSGEFVRAEEIHRSVLESRRKLLGEQNVSTVDSMNSLALALLNQNKLPEAIELSEKAVDKNRELVGQDHPESLSTLGNLASALNAAGRLRAALPLYEEVLKRRKATLGPEHVDSINSMSNYALALDRVGQIDKAIPLFESSLDLMEKQSGADHPDVLRIKNNLATCYMNMQEFDDAVQMLESCLPVMREKLGENDDLTLSAMSNLSVAFQSMGKFQLALEIQEETLQLTKEKLGLSHPDTLISMGNLAGTYQALGEYEKSVPLFEEVFEISKTSSGVDHPETLVAMNNLGFAYSRTNRVDRAIEVFEELIPLMTQKLGRSHPNTQMAIANLGYNQLRSGSTEKAIELLKEASSAAQDYPMLRWASDSLRKAYITAGQNEEFQQLANQQLEQAKEEFANDSPRLANLRAVIGTELLSIGAFAEAEKVLRQSVDVRKKIAPDSWSTFNAESVLGGALMGQKKYEEAEPLLLSGYKGMKDRISTIPGPARLRLPQAVNRLVQFYEDQDNPDELAKWRAERETYGGIQ